MPRQGLPQAQPTDCPFKSRGLVPTLHALGCPPTGLQMSLAVQREGKGWPSGALTPPTQPPASFLEISERTFVWAAKLNLPPSCQGIGKAVRGKGKGESGVGGKGAAGRRAGESEQAIQAGRILVPVTLNTASPRSCSSRGRRLSGSRHRNRDLATGLRIGSGLLGFLSLGGRRGPRPAPGWRHKVEL